MADQRHYCNLALLELGEGVCRLWGSDLETDKLLRRTGAAALAPVLQDASPNLSYLVLKTIPAFGCPSAG